MIRPFAKIGMTLAVGWSVNAGAIAPATPQQMLCDPSAFVVATVTANTSRVEIPKDCKNSDVSCNISLDLRITVDQILATEPSALTPIETSSYQPGKTLSATVSAVPSSEAQRIVPSDFQGGLLVPLVSDRQLRRQLQGSKFIFGLGSAKKPLEISQVWSLGFQGDVEQTLIDDRGNNARKESVSCPALDELTQLENAVKAHPSTSKPLIELAKLHERARDEKANGIYRKAIALDKGNEALEGFIRTLGAEDATWAGIGLEVATEVLARSPSNPIARRLHDQSLIRSGQEVLIDKVDLSHGIYDTLRLSNRHMRNARLQGSIINQLEASDADLSYADFSGAQILEGSFSRSNLLGARFEGASLSDIILFQANFAKTSGLKRISSKSAAGASFLNADLNGAGVWIKEQGARFPLAPYDSDYVDAEDNEPEPKDRVRPTIQFSGANLKQARMEISGLKIDFSGADLTGAEFDVTDLRGANLSKAKLDHAVFYYTIYDCSTKWPEHFVPSAPHLILLPGSNTCK